MIVRGVMERPQLQILPAKYWDIPCGNIPNPGRRPTQIQMEDFVRGRRKIIRNILRFHALGPFAYRITAQLSFSRIQVKVTLAHMYSQVAQ